MLRRGGGGSGGSRVGIALVAAAALALTACPKKPTPDPSAGDASAVAEPEVKVGNAVNGEHLVGQFQCNRCHDGTGFEPAPQALHCVRCHVDIVAGRFKAPQASLARWAPRVKDLTEAPSLEASGTRLSRAYVASYLLAPTHLRPHLRASMPRLALTDEQARDIAAYLVPVDARVIAHSASGSNDLAPLAGADLGKGRALLDTKGCGSCHTFGGVAAIAASAPPAMDGREFARGHTLAPDLRATRERMSAKQLVAWLKDPKGVKRDTPMPNVGLSDVEARDLAAYIGLAELAAPETPARFVRLPVLARKVTYKEVDERVFRRTCWHCHSDPDDVIGDGGPGNSGGFGFRPRGLNVTSYQAISAGMIDDAGERQSIFTRDEDGVPRIVRALVARHDEAGGATGAIRGMPLGYPALSAEDIQLVETWVSQGRPK